MKKAIVVVIVTWLTLLASGYHASTQPNPIATSQAAKRSQLETLSR